jgi:hypothetical protein
LLTEKVGMLYHPVTKVFTQLFHQCRHEKGFDKEIQCVKDWVRISKRLDKVFSTSSGVGQKGSRHGGGGKSSSNPIACSCRQARAISAFPVAVAVAKA